MIKSTFNHSKTVALTTLSRFGGLAEWLGCLVAVAVILGIGGPRHKSVETRLLAITPPPSVEIAIPEAAVPPPVKAGPKPIFTFKRHKGEGRFHPLILKAADRYEVDPALVKAIIKAESGYDAKAVSSSGAVGLMQLMPATAEELGVKDGFNPEHNINGGVKYFKKLMDQFGGNVSLALAAYNAGSRKVRLYQGVPPFKSTRYYVKKVFKYYRFYKNQMAAGTDNA